MKPKKIVIVTPYYAPAWSYGGPPRILSALAAAWQRQKIEVVVITTDAFDHRRWSEVKVDYPDQQQVYRFANFSNHLAFFQKIFWVPNLLSVSQEVFKSAELVVFGDLRSIMNWQLWWWVWQHQIPYLVFPFGQVPIPNDWKGQIKRVFDKIWVNNFMKRAELVLAQTQHEAMMVNQYYPDAKTIVVPLPMVKSKSKFNRQMMAKVGQELNIKPAAKVLLFVGRLHWLKGVDLLIKAVIPWLVKNSDWQLVIVGRDEGEASKLMAMIPSKLKTQIILAGAKYGEEVQALYRRAQIFIFTPRFYEETSTAALEALAVGAPVITTEQADLPFLEQYGVGLVVKNHPNQIRQAINKLSKVEPEILAKAAKLLISEKFEVNKIAAQILRHLK